MVLNFMNLRSLFWIPLNFRILKTFFSIPIFIHPHFTSIPVWEVLYFRFQIHPCPSKFIPIPVREARLKYCVSQFLPYLFLSISNFTLIHLSISFYVLPSSKFFILTAHLTIIVHVYLNIMNTIVFHLVPNQSKKW